MAIDDTFLDVLQIIIDIKHVSSCICIGQRCFGYFKTSFVYIIGFRPFVRSYIYKLLRICKQPTNSTRAAFYTPRI